MSDNGPPSAGAAPTATTVKPVVARPRRWLRFFLLLVFVTVTVGAAVWIVGDFQTTREFREEAREVLTTLSTGDADDLEAFYEGKTSFRFQQIVLLDKFTDEAMRIRQVLGPFVRIVDVIDVEESATVAGMAARVEMELEFAGATTRGDISLHRGRDEGASWKLLGFNIDIPTDKLAKEARKLQGDEERTKAPKPVLDMVPAILTDIRDGKAEQVYDQASPAFQASKSREEFLAMLKTHRSELGNFEQVIKILTSAQSPDQDKARVQALLKYQKLKSGVAGTFEFLRGSDNEWRMRRFKIVVPPPLLPPRESAQAPAPTE